MTGSHRHPRTNREFNTEILQLLVENAAVAHEVIATTVGVRLGAGLYEKMLKKNLLSRLDTNAKAFSRPIFLSPWSTGARAIGVNRHFPNAIAQFERGLAANNDEAMKSEAI